MDQSYEDYLCIPLLFLLFISCERKQVHHRFSQRNADITDETLPVFAEEKLGSKYIIKYCTAQKEGSDRHVLRNAGAIESAHLLFVSVRTGFRTRP